MELIPLILVMIMHMFITGVIINIRSQIEQMRKFSD